MLIGGSLYVKWTSNIRFPAVHQCSLIDVNVDVIKPQNSNYIILETSNKDQFYIKGNLINDCEINQLNKLSETDTFIEISTYKFKWSNLQEVITLSTEREEIITYEEAEFIYWQDCKEDIIIPIIFLVLSFISCSYIILIILLRMKDRTSI